MPQFEQRERVGEMKTCHEAALAHCILACEFRPRNAKLSSLRLSER